MSTPKRLRITEHFEVRHLADEILVKCPNCRHCARAGRPVWSEKDRIFRVPMSCLQCGRQHEFVLNNCHYWNALPLWLTTSCCGELLWAFNSRHVAALQDFVAAGLRENKLGHRTNRHLFMSLPRWITSKKNRPDVLRGLKRLQAKLSRQV